MSVIRQSIAVARKDLLIEWRSPSRVSGILFFALALLLMVAFTTDASAATLRKQAGGALWLGMLLASTRSLDLSYAIETEEDALEGLVLWPVDPRAMFFGKAIANTTILFLVASALTPLAIAIFDAPIYGSVTHYVAFLALGSAALAAPGTLYALLTARARSASVLLPVLLFPLVVPALIAASRGTSLAMEGDLMNQAPSWLKLLFLFNAVHWSLDALLYGRIVEDG